MVDGRLGLVIADVTGHGVGPALLMAETRAFARAAAAIRDSLDLLLFLVNNLLAHDLGGGRFVTLFWGLLDANTGAFQYSSAGHGHAVLFRAGRVLLEELESTAPPLGIVQNLHFPMGPDFKLEKGDVLLITTDGLEEAMDAQGNEFGRPRLRDALRANAHASAPEIAHAIHDEVRRFIAGAPQRDDLTMIVLKALA
jgi:serine phosphatase RsbU (regulator of sigma subunit)